MWNYISRFSIVAIVTIVAIVATIGSRLSHCRNNIFDDNMIKCNDLWLNIWSCEKKFLWPLGVHSSIIRVELSKSLEWRKYKNAWFYPSTHFFSILRVLMDVVRQRRAVTASATIEIQQMQFLSPIFESSLLIELGFKYVSYRVSKLKIFLSSAYLFR